MIPPQRISSIAWHNKGENIPSRLSLDNGTIIEFRAFEQGREAFQGVAWDAFYGDEQMARDSKIIFQEIQRGLIDKRGFYAHSMTPLIPMPWLEQRTLNPGEADEFFFCDLNDNRKSRGGYLDDDEIDLMISEWPSEVQDTRIRGLFASFEGVVFKNFSRRDHVIPHFRPPPEWDKYRGIDFGFSNPFACVWLAVSPDGEWHVYREYHVPGKLLRVHAAEIKRRSGDESYRWTCADHDAQGRAEINDYGINTVPARKSILSGIEVMQRFMMVRDEIKKPRFFVHDNCPVSASQLGGYRWPEGTDTKDPKEDPLKKDDHCVDPIRYVMYAVEGKGYFSGVLR